MPCAWPSLEAALRFSADNRSHSVRLACQWGAQLKGVLDVSAHSMSTLCITHFPLHEAQHSAALEFKAGKSSPCVWLACQRAGTAVGVFGNGHLTVQHGHCIFLCRSCKTLATCPADLDVGGAVRRLQQALARPSYQCPGGSCMPSLAALPQQTDADLLRPPVLANDHPYAVAGGSLPVPVPQRATCKAARQASCAGPHQDGPAPSGR